MSGLIRDHIRSNVVGYIALFCFAMSGTAVALDGSNTVFSDDIVNNGVRSEDVRDDTLSNGGLAAVDLAPNSVGLSEIAPNSVISADIIDGAIGPDDLTSNSVRSEHIQLDAVGSAEIAANSVGPSETAPDSVGQSDIVSGGVATSEIATETINTTDIATDGVRSSDISQDAVGSSEVLDNSLTGVDIADGDGQDSHPADCDPGTNYINCGQLTFSLGQPMPVLLMWNWAFGSPSGDAAVSVGCRTLVDGNVTEAHANNDEDVYAFGEAGTPFVDVRSLGAGNHVAQFQCAQITGDASVQDLSIAAIELAVD